MLHSFISRVVAGALALGAVVAHAAPLAPGDGIFVTGSTAISHPELAGSVVQDDVLTTGGVYIPEGQTFSWAWFDVENRVVRSHVDGGLIFSPRIRFGGNVTPFDLLVERVAIWGFGDYALDVSYRVDQPGDRGPTGATRSGDGDRLDFAFGFPLFSGNLSQEPHEESYFLALKSDASAYANTGRLSIFARAVGAEGDSASLHGDVFRFDVHGLAAPVDGPAPVPAPASALLLLAGLGVLMRLRR